MFLVRNILDNPRDIQVLAPLIRKEINYRVLQGDHGGMLKQIAIEGSSTHQISDVIEHIMKNYEKSFKIEELADSKYECFFTTSAL